MCHKHPALKCGLNKVNGTNVSKQRWQNCIVVPSPETMAMLHSGPSGSWKCESMLPGLGVWK